MSHHLTIGLSPDCPEFSQRGAVCDMCGKFFWAFTDVRFCDHCATQRAECLKGARESSVSEKPFHRWYPNLAAALVMAHALTGDLKFEYGSELERRIDSLDAPRGNWDLIGIDATIESLSPAQLTDFVEGQAGSRRAFGETQAWELISAYRDVFIA